MSSDRYFMTLSPGVFAYYCPGCQEYHGVWTEKSPNPSTGATWTLTFDNEGRPTVHPSLNVNPNTDRICHSWIKKGKIEFLKDCWHDLKATTVEMHHEQD